MKETITLSGKIVFDVEDYTRKHKLQSSWKKVAMVFIDGDVCEYYSWFLQRRYNIILNKPLRGLLNIISFNISINLTAQWL